MRDMVDWIKATSDIMVRVLLGQEENLPLLMDFIIAVLKDRGVVPVKELTLENPINMRTVFNAKDQTRPVCYPLGQIKKVDVLFYRRGRSGGG